MTIQHLIFLTLRETNKDAANKWKYIETESAKVFKNTKIKSVQKKNLNEKKGIRKAATKAKLKNFGFPFGKGGAIQCKLLTS